MLFVRLSKFVIILGLSVCGLLAGQSATPALPPGVTRGASVEGITEYQLQNGLRVLLFPDPTKTTTTVNITYLVGSRNEDYGETGMAHLLEHMLFKGAPRHRNVMQEVTAHGSRWNGTTDSDRTNYFETFEANDANLDWALDLEADRMVNSFVAKKDLDSEMTVVRNEFESAKTIPPAFCPNASCRPPISGTTTANLRSVLDRILNMCRLSGCKTSTGAIISPITRS